MQSTRCPSSREEVRRQTATWHDDNDMASHNAWALRWCTASAGVVARSSSVTAGAARGCNAHA